MNTVRSILSVIVPLHPAAICLSLPLALDANAPSEFTDLFPSVLAVAVIVYRATLAIWSLVLLIKFFTFVSDCFYEGMVLMFDQRRKTLPELLELFLIVVQRVVAFMLCALIGCLGFALYLYDMGGSIVVSAIVIIVSVIYFIVKSKCWEG